MTNSGKNPKRPGLHENDGNAKLTLLGELFLENFEEMGTAPAVLLRSPILATSKVPKSQDCPIGGRNPPAFS